GHRLHSRLAENPLQLAVGSLLMVGLVVSGVLAATGTSGNTTPASEVTGQGVGYGYSYEAHGKKTGHRLHCPSEQGQEQSKGHAQCHQAPRRVGHSTPASETTGQGVGS